MYVPCFLSYVLCHLVFQSKVLQRLYPAAPKVEKEPSPPSIVEALANKTSVKRKASQGDNAAGKIRNFDPLPLKHTHTYCCHPTALNIWFHYFSLFATSVSGDAGQTQIAANPHRRMYTVLPPPADYKAHAEKSVTLAQLDSINSAEDPAGKSAIILHLWTCAMHHKARRDLRHGLSPCWLFIVLKSLFLIVSATLVKGNRQW